VVKTAARIKVKKVQRVLTISGRRQSARSTTNSIFNPTTPTLTYASRKHTYTMHFSTLLVPPLAAIVFAVPNELIRRDNEQVAAAIFDVIHANNCSILKCVEDVANAGCIAAAIASSPEGIPVAPGCVNEEAEQVYWNDGCQECC
jgi:hypothetical protein